MSMTHETAVLQSESLLQQLARLQAFLQASAQEGKPLHEVELGLWHQLLRMGRTCLGEYLDRHGTGDVGETLTLPTGQQCQRLDELHERR